jgi:hypothetical protein
MLSNSHLRKGKVVNFAVEITEILFKILWKNRAKYCVLRKLHQHLKELTPA